MLEKLLGKISFFDAFVILIAATAAVSFWRGVWGLMDIYLFPKNSQLSFFISIIISLIILVLISIYHGKNKK